MRRSWRVAAVRGACGALVCAVVFGVMVVATAASAGHADAGSEIVFASDRASANPGEIYALTAAGSPVDVSRSAAADWDGVVTADGRLVAFFSDRTGAWRIYLSRPDGTGLRLLPAPLPGSQGYSERSLEFSPDGSQLLVAPREPAKCMIFVVDVQTLRARRAGEGCSASWSPDGSRIAATASSGHHVSAYDAAGRRRFSLTGVTPLWSPDGHLAVVDPTGTSTTVVGPRGSRVTRLAGVAGAWSPDGTKLVLTRPGALVLADWARPARSRLLVRGPRSWLPYGAGIAFTPDGKYVRYQRSPTHGRPSDWVVIAVAGGAPRLLPGNGAWARDGRYAFPRVLPSAHTGGLDRVEIEIGNSFGRKPRLAGTFSYGPLSVSQLTWSADGNRLLYETSVPTLHDLWAVDANGSNLRRLTPSLVADARAPAWSSDGMRLIYTSTLYGGACSYTCTRVAIATPEGQGQSLVTGLTAEGTEGGFVVNWAPSGTQLLVNATGEHKMYTAGLDGTNVFPLAPGPAGDSALSCVWSPDATTIAYVSSDGIDLIAPDGSDRRQLLPISSYAQLPRALSWSYDSKFLAYSAAHGIYVLPADGSAPPRLVVAADSPGGLSYSPDGTELVYSALHQTPGARPQYDLYIAPTQGGPARTLAPSPFDDIDPAWRPVPAS
jgi:Tol biopolymer transport system component